MTFFPPSSQKAGARPISFVLSDESAFPPSVTTLEMVIRPEELTRTDVSRITVQQTLGGAWADDFGPGLSTINISGHTGWRGGSFSSSDGMEEFSKLKNQVFTNWHKRRNAAKIAGVPPSSVTLLFSDALDSEVDIVIPMTFTLRRSKSRPLLMQFNISMISISSGIDATSEFSVDDLLSSSLVSMSMSIGDIETGIGDAVNFVQASIVTPVVAFMNLTASILHNVAYSLQTVGTVGEDLMGIAIATSQSGFNMFSTLGALPGAAAAVVGSAMAVANAYSNVLCLLNNAINQKIIYQDYSAIYGSSNCSSTNGGSPVSPYANTNPFYAMVGIPEYAAPPTASANTLPTVVVSPVPDTTVTVSTLAQQSLSELNNTDPVLSPLSTTNIGIAAGNIASGVALS